MANNKNGGEFIRFESRENLIRKLGEIIEELQTQKSLLEQNGDFFELLSLPDTAPDERMKALRRVFESQVSDETLAIVSVLSERLGLYDYYEYLDEYRRLLGDNRTFSRGEVHSVVPLTDEQISEFAAKTGKLIGREVVLVNRIDPDILGGVVIMIDGKMIDLSLRKRLEDMHISVSRGLTAEKESEL